MSVIIYLCAVILSSVAIYEDWPNDIDPAVFILGLIALGLFFDGISKAFSDDLGPSTKTQ